MAINIRIRDGLCPDPTTGDGGATEGDIRGSFSDIIDVIGVKDLAGGHCLVTQNSPAALSVLVAPGVVYIPNADYDELDSNTVKFWEAIITVSTAVTITANTSGSTRIDLICAKMDTAVTPDEHASNIATLVAVAGTPGAGTPATPDNHYVLATVAVANGASTIVNADITSTRVQSKIDFDFLPKATGAEINTGTEDAKIVTPKAIADSKVSITDKVETLTNKTLTSPKINEDVALTSTATELNNLHSKTLNLGAWTSYTVTPTNLTIGSGTMAGKYIQIGKLVIGKIRIVLAADSSISGTVYLSKPVTSVSTSFPTTEGDCSFLDSGTAEASGRLLSSDTGKFTVQVFNTAGTYLTIAAVNATVPWTWATGDVIDCKFVYEAA